MQRVLCLIRLNKTLHLLISDLLLYKGFFSVIILAEKAILSGLRLLMHGENLIDFWECISRWRRILDLLHQVIRYDSPAWCHARLFWRCFIIPQVILLIERFLINLINRWYGFPVSIILIIIIKNMFISRLVINYSGGMYSARNLIENKLIGNSVGIWGIESAHLTIILGEKCWVSFVEDILL